uniref:hypothetical protein n=2 Tax=Legionella pneumophila TaxID=446 RepID=UPI001F3C9F60
KSDKFCSKYQLDDGSYLEVLSILQAAFSSLNINYQGLILDSHEKMDYQFAAVSNHRLMLIPYHWHDGLKHGEKKRR